MLAERLDVRCDALKRIIRLVSEEDSRFGSFELLRRTAEQLRTEQGNLSTREHILLTEHQAVTVSRRSNSALHPAETV